jgi:hypothetical protein
MTFFPCPSLSLVVQDFPTKRPFMKGLLYFQETLDDLLVMIIMD